MAARDVLESVFVGTLGLPPVATGFLLELWDVLQGLDDWMDDTPTSRESRLCTIWLALVSLPGHPFMRANAAELVPLLASLVLRWQAANVVEAERDAEQLPKAYVWRAGFYDIVLHAVLLVHGAEAALRMGPTVMRIYGERLDEYLKEFTHA